jgi:hypothetical protein
MKHSREVMVLGNELLKVSCRKAIERSRMVEGTYKMVKCSFKSPKKFYLSIRMNKKLYNEWLRLTEIYIENGKKLVYRPTIDRINENGHYYISNIQILSFGQNSAKAHSKK